MIVRAHYLGILLLAALTAIAGSIPAASPTPSPMTMPTPVPGNYVASPNLDGAAAFHVGFDISKGLAPTWGTAAIPGLYTAGNTDEGAFRFTCKGDGPVKPDDPVLYPGQPGKSHLHLFWGNRSVDASTTPVSLAASVETNCNNTLFSLNRSSYWMPALIDDQGRVKRPDVGISVYYKRPTSRSAFCTAGSSRYYGICVGIPNEIRFIFGWDPTRPFAKVVGASWYCTTGTNLHYSNLDDVFNSGCAVGSIMVADTTAPNCWDGKYLDSPDHRSHMAYQFYDGTRADPVCPKGYPYIVPTEENKAMWTVAADMIGIKPNGTFYSRVRLSSDAMLPGAKPGQTLHADYMEKWDADAKKIWLENCIEKALSCSGGDLGNGQQLIGA